MSIQRSCDKVLKVLRRLEKAYGPRPWRRWGDPVSILVEAILSQNTSDKNSSAAFKSLRRRLRSWPQVADAPTEVVVESIRTAGLSRIKAPRIQKILRAIRRGRGRINLDFLAAEPPPAAMDYLCRFDGVGPKTAQCVLLFSLGMPVFPVDTHIFRIATRLGLLPSGTGPPKAHEVLIPLIPPRHRYALHVLLIEHGRRTCRARNPLCQWCPLIDLCLFGKNRLAAAQ